MTDDLAGSPFDKGLQSFERGLADHFARLTENGVPIPGTEYTEYTTPLMEIQSSVMPLSIIFDVVAYLDRDHTEVEMFDMIQRLKAAFE